MERQINPPADGRDRPHLGSLANAALPIVALLVFGLAVVATLAVAGDTLGYDFLAYHAAAARVLDAHPVYDLAYDIAGPSGLFLYPPTFVPLVLVFGLLPASAATWMWIGLLLAAFAVGVALLPVSRQTRWVVVLLAGQSWPFLYNLKLGQVGPLLFLLFVIGWRWMDRPRVLGATGALGAAIKLQPGLILVWALMTRRWAAIGVSAVVLAVLAIFATFLAGPQSWPDYVTLIGRVSDAITTPHNAAPGAVAFQLGASRDVSAVIQWTSTGLALAAVAWAAVRMAAVPSYLVAVIASQLMSPVLWDHYAMLLLLPVAWMVDRGRWWTMGIVLASSVVVIDSIPAWVYPLEYWACLVAVLAVASNRGRGVLAWGTSKAPVTGPIA